VHDKIVVTDDYAADNDDDDDDDVTISAINRYLVKTLPFVDKDRVAFQGWVSHLR